MAESKYKEISAPLDAKGLKLALVVSRYNSLICKELLSGAIDAIVRHGGREADLKVIWAPGGFEIPILVKAVLDKGGVDGVITLGCVLKGETPHNDHISNEVVKGVSSLSLEYGVPVGFGVLTPNTLEQALNRAGVKMGNKGAEAALAVIEAAQAIKLIKK